MNVKGSSRGGAKAEKADSKLVIAESLKLLFARSAL